MPGEVTREELNIYMDGVNGDLEDIKKAVAKLDDTMNRRFDALDAKFETERKEGLGSHRRIHERVDATNLSLAAEMVGVSDTIDDVKEGFGKALGKVKEEHMSKGIAYFLTFITALALSAITAFVTLLLAR